MHRLNQQPSRRDRRTIFAAFTLVELMIAIALMLLLMVGINVIFSMTSRAVGAGQALSDGIKSAQSAQTVMSRDFETAAIADAPYMVLQSATKPAFRNRVDMLADRDYDPTVATPANTQTILTTDIDGLDSNSDGNYEGDPNVNGERISPAIYNARNHRIDIISFFSRDTHHRQTGGGTLSGSSYEPLVGDLSSNEACIWYGHLQLPDNNATFTSSTNPGAGTFGSNPNNFFASQWILGRVAILLREPTRGSPSGNGTIVTGGVSHDFFDRIISNSYPLSPLQYNSAATSYGEPAPAFGLQSSRYDLAGTSMARFRDVITELINTNGTFYNWWQPLMLSARFQCNPFVTKPLDAKKYAQQMPIFVPACTQFIVEYAGDFVKQNRDPADNTAGGSGDAAGVFGDVQDAYFEPPSALNPYEIRSGGSGTDGEVDFVVLNPGTASARKQIRWYGLPRDTNGDGVIRAVPASGGANGLPDVVPLLDVVRTAVGGTYSNATRTPAERLQWNGSTLTPQQSTPTLRTSAGGAVNYADPATGMTSAEYYTCAWGPHDRKPSLIRVTIVVDDPSGRLGEGQTFEYVFKIQ